MPRRRQWLGDYVEQQAVRDDLDVSWPQRIGGWLKAHFPNVRWHGSNNYRFAIRRSLPAAPQ
jgi:hypothetical protein